MTKKDVKLYKQKQSTVRNDAKRTKDERIVSNKTKQQNDGNADNVNKGTPAETMDTSDESEEDENPWDM